ncbi:MAG: class I SAM-dependent methyltransferase [Actinomycetota bacterium]
MRAAPWLVYHKLRGKSPRNYSGQWNDYWSQATSTDDENSVLWDIETDTEITDALTDLEPHIDRSLPMLDLGCGNGRRSRFLASTFEQVIGVDVSAAAVELAEAQTDDERVSYQVLDGLDTDAVATLSDEVGPMNVYMRGVFHVIHDKDRPTFLANLATLLGDKGTLYQLETDGAALEYFLEHPEDSPSGLPKLMHRVIEAGIIPHGFGEADVQRWFHGEGWDVLAEGASHIHSQPVGGEVGRVPAYFTIARPPTTS